MTEWRVCCYASDRTVQALRAYSLRLTLESYGFAVAQYEQSPCVFCVQHHSPYALTLLLLKTQLPKGVTVEQVVK